MKSVTKLICLFLVVAMILPTAAFAAEAVEPRGSSYFTKHGAYVERMSSTKLDIWFEVTATGTMEVLGAKTIKLQRSTDHSNWETIKTYSMDDYSQMTDTNTAGHSGCVSYSSASSGYYYRAQITFYAKNSSGTGQYVMNTSYI